MIPPLNKSDVFLSMILCSLFFRDIPMNYREKVLMCALIMKYIDVYIKTEADLIWVNKQIEQMESNVAIRRSDTIEWGRTSYE